MKLLTLNEINLLPQGTTKDGYIIRYLPIGHPQNPHTTSAWVTEHRLVMESILGRIIQRCEVVHHIDKNKKHNVPSNLSLTNPSIHGRTHNPPNGLIKICPICNKPFYAKPCKINTMVYCSVTCARKSPASIVSTRKNLKPKTPDLKTTKYIVDQKDNGRTWKSLSKEIGITMWSVRSRYAWYMKYANRKPIYISTSSHLIKRIKVKCGYCGKPLEVTPCKLKNSISGNVFCNHRCSGKFNNGKAVKGKPFTNEEDEQIKTLYCNGLNHNQIAKRINRNRTSIQNRLVNYILKQGGKF